MDPRSTRRGRTLQIAGSAVFGALAWFLAVPLFLRIPFFPLTYLTFDFAEIPVMFAFLVFGPAAGAISSFVLWGTLSFVGSTGIFGATMKFVAVASSALGLWLGITLSQRIPRRTGLRGALLSGLGLALLLRVAAMTAANYVALVIVFPEFLGFAASLVTNTGLTGGPSPMASLLAILLFTGIYNVTHVFLSLLPSFFLSTVPSAASAFRSMGEPWIARISRR